MSYYLTDEYQAGNSLLIHILEERPEAQNGQIVYSKFHEWAQMRNHCSDSTSKAAPALR